MSAFISLALVDVDRTAFRRWSFSIMLVAVLHAAITMTVLVWHLTSRTLDAGAPIDPWFVDLAPRSAAGSAEPGQPQLVRDAGAFDEAKNVRGNAVNGGTNTASAGLPPSEAEPGMKGFNGGDDTGTGVAASHALPMGHSEESPIEARHAGHVELGPIDTSITVMPPALHQRKALGAFDRNGTILQRPAQHPGQVEPSRNNPGAFTNAPGANGLGDRGSLSHGVGAHVQDRVNAAIQKDIMRRAERARNGTTARGTDSLGINAPGTVAHDNAKNAIGVGTPNSRIGTSPAAVVNGVARNAIGMATEFHPSAHGLGVGERRAGGAGVARAIELTGVSPGSAGLKIGAPSPGILNGRGMARPGTSLAALGGPPKNVPGVLSGSDFHSKLGTRYGP